MGLFSGDAQAGAGDRFAVLVVQVGCYGLDGFAVQSGAGEIGQAEQEQLKIQIREALAERSTNYLEVGCHKVRLSDFSSTRLDSKAIKAVAPDLYDQYSKTVTGTRLSIT